MHKETPLRDPALEKLTELIVNMREILTFLEQRFTWYEDCRIPEALAIMAREIDETLGRMARIEPPTVH